VGDGVETDVRMLVADRVRVCDGTDVGTGVGIEVRMGVRIGVGT
jgi:hypothetical protein